MSYSSPLRLAVCLFPDVTALDFQGPIELLGCITPKRLRMTGHRFKTLPSTSIEITYLSHNLEPVEPMTGPLLQINNTYETEEQFDILLIPGGQPTKQPADVTASHPTLRSKREARPDWRIFD